MKTYLPGIDHAWLATDDIGHVAIFTTGGEGPMPASAVPEEELALEDGLLALPVSSGVLMHIAYPRPDDYRALAQRGLYAFDWTDVHRGTSRHQEKYQLVAQPEHALMLEQLPTQLRAAATRLRGVLFAQAIHSGITPQG